MKNKSDIAHKVEQMGLRTVRGEAREGFFIPYRYAGAVPDIVAPYDALSPLFEAQRAAMSTWLNKAEAHATTLSSFDGSGASHARLDQYWCPRLDAAMAYTLVRELRPARIIEIGSGHSTRFMVQAIGDANVNCAFTAIDPAPRAGLAELPVTFLAKTLQETDLALFSKLKAGDFLCVDSSHILMPGSDVDIIINRILPMLPRGVIVFFHDIFLPEAYPSDWLWRGYNEQNAVGGLLQGGYELVFASHYAVQQMADVFEALAIAKLPLLPGAHECGLWLRKL